MPSRKRADAAVDAEIARVKALRDPQGLSAALGDARARVVIAAANVAREHEEHGCERALVEAFVRLVKAADPVERDPQCRAKTAVLEAIVALEAEGEGEAYAAGLHLRQLEAAWGESVDTAANVRGLSVLGMVRVRHPDAAVFAAEALVDSERVVRAAAARALGESTPEAGLPVLRLKLAVGDKEPEVVGACLAAYLELSLGAGLALARQLLESAGEAEQEAFLLALGESRRPEAFEVLRDYQGRATATACVAMAVLRHEPATAWLVQAIAHGPRTLGLHAARALAHFRHDSALCERIRAAARERDDVAFGREVEQALSKIV